MREKKKPIPLVRYWLILKRGAYSGTATPSISSMRRASASSATSTLMYFPRTAASVHSAFSALALMPIDHDGVRIASNGAEMT